MMPVMMIEKNRPIQKRLYRVQQTSLATQRSRSFALYHLLRVLRLCFEGRQEQIYVRIAKFLLMFYNSHSFRA